MARQTSAAPLRCIIAVLAALFALAASPAAIAAGALPDRAPRGAPFEFAVADVPLVANPYDPDAIRVEAEFEAPSGRRLRVPGFYQLGIDPLFGVPTHDDGWRVRFTPEEVGRYAVRVRLALVGDKEFQTIYNGAFACVASDNIGFLRRALPPAHFVATDRGRAVALVGQNLPWGNRDDPAVYLEQLDALARAGGNCVRIWLAPWWLPIEGYGDGLHARAGRYEQRACALLDAILERCAKRGIYAILVIEQHGNFEPRGGEVGLWPRHPYNQANGGPCATPTDFFASGAARRLMRHKLRYLAARYGASPALLGWELFNEAEHVPFAHGTLADNLPAVLDWHRDMSRCLRDSDAFDRLVMTSADEELQRALLLAGAVDALDLHVYADAGLAERVAQRVGDAVRRCGAPVFVGEFGTRAKDGRLPLDAALWTAWATGAAALPWHEGHGDHTGLAAAYRALRATADAAADDDGLLAPLRAEAVAIGDGPPPPPEYADVAIPLTQPFGEDKPGAMSVDRDGALSQRKDFSRFLRPDVDGERPAYVLDVDFPRDGKVGVFVNKVSARAVIEVSVDGQRVGSETLITGPNNKLAKSSTWIEKWRIYQDVYDREYAFPVPAGRHRIRIENSGSDWAEIDHLRLIGYRPVDNAPAVVYAGGGKRGARALVVRRDDDVKVASIRFRLVGLLAGRYAVEWWDCRSIKPLSRARADADDTGLPLKTPPFTGRIAVRITRAE